MKRAQLKPSTSLTFEKDLLRKRSKMVIRFRVCPSLTQDLNISNCNIAIMSSSNTYAPL